MKRLIRESGLDLRLFALGCAVAAATLTTGPRTAEACVSCTGSGVVRDISNSTSVPSSSNNAGFQIQSSGTGTWSMAGVGTAAANTFTIFNDVQGVNAITINPAANAGFSANSSTFYGDIRPATTGTRQVGNTVFWYLQMVANNFLVMSDRRLKSDIQPLAPGLDTLRKLQPVSFKWNSDPTGPQQFGLIAQDVKAVLPNLVTTDATSPNSPMSVNYTELIPVLIRGVQQQQVLIEKQAAQIARLENQSKAVSLGDTGSGTTYAAIPLGLIAAWQLLRRRQSAPAATP